MKILRLAIIACSVLWLGIPLQGGPCAAAPRLGSHASSTRLDPGPSALASPPAPSRKILEDSNVAAADRRRLDGLVGLRVDRVRRWARLYESPAELQLAIPAETGALRFHVAARADDASCELRLRTSWRGAATERRLRHDGGWQPVVLAASGASPAPLRIRAQSADCEAFLAVSEIQLRRRRIPLTGRPDLLLIVLDTVRRDHFDCSDVTADLMPNLYRSWCQRGLYLDDAFSTTSWTYPAVASMLTGLGPRQHGGIRLQRGGHKDLPLSVTTLPEILRWSGYATGAVVSNWQAARGLWRGFDRFAERQPGKRRDSAEGEEPEHGRAEAVVDDAIRWLEDERDFGSGEPVFTWLLFRDVHEPVDAARHVDRIPEECRGIQPLPVRWEGIDRAHRRGGAAEPPNMGCRRALYREALRYIDDQLGRLMQHLERSGRASRTAVVVVSDHGEELWDHAAEGLAEKIRVQVGYGHGHTLYGELVRVPLLVVPPGGVGGAAARSGRLVSVRDVFATLLGMAGAQLPARSRSLDLRRLLPGADGASAWRTHVVSETTMYGPDRYSVSTGELRAIRTVGGETLVFDRNADPLEKSPLPSDSPLAKRGERLLNSVLLKDGGYSRPTAEDREALRALGYIR